MPRVHVNGASLYYEESGSGPETIVFAHGLLFSGQMFEAQINALKDHYHCISFDFRGQGQSQVTRGGYDMETLYEDTVSLLSSMQATPCHFVGLSMGGFIGMRIAARRPELLKSLTLLDTSADPEPSENILRYKMLGLVARWLSIGLVIDKVMPVMFGRKFMNDPARAALRKEWKQRMIANNKAGSTRALRGVLNRQGVYGELASIKIPTLVMVGDQDVATVPAKSERIHNRIAGSKLITIPGAGHSPSIEEPDFINQSIGQFLQSLTPTAETVS